MEMMMMMMMMMMIIVIVIFAALIRESTYRHYKPVYMAYKNFVNCNSRLQIISTQNGYFISVGFNELILLLIPVISPFNNIVIISFAKGFFGNGSLSVGDSV
jgi:hypothetical protein